MVVFTSQPPCPIAKTASRHASTADESTPAESVPQQQSLPVPRRQRPTERRSRNQGTGGQEGQGARTARRLREWPRRPGCGRGGSGRGRRGADAAPYGARSHAALEDGSQPDGFDIKGNADSMLYHVPGQPVLQPDQGRGEAATEAAPSAARVPARLAAGRASRTSSSSVVKDPRDIMWPPW